MVQRRAEIPSLNRSITRVVRYVSGRDIYGSAHETVERSARVRRLEISAKDQFLFLGSSGEVDKAVRRYLTRPVYEELAITYDNSGVSEARTIRLKWSIGDTFKDSGRTWTVLGIGHYDSSGRMLELLVDSAR